MRSQFNVRPSEGMTLARIEIRERHFVSAANFGVHLMHLGGKSVRRKPFGHRVGIEKCLVNLFGCRSEDAVKSNSICCHNLSLFVYLAFVSGSIIPKTLPAGSAA